MMNVILAIMAGLGLFMYGMKLMGDGIEKALGEKLRDVLERCTKNKITGLIVGIVFTGIIQSSSAATVLTVGFVNSAMMNLYQATGIILGANIGTTVTGQLMALDLSKWAPIIMLVGIIMIMFVNKTIIKKYGEVVLGFGALFYGMDTMSTAMKMLDQFPAVRNTMSSLDNAFIAIIIGIVVTALVQSSSATVGILMVLAANDMVTLRMSMFVILGSNIGACTSAMLASLGAKKDAKRTAWIHLLFNIFGTALMVILLLVVEGTVTNFIGMFSDGKNNVFVANANSIFKIFQVLVMFPFTNGIVKLTHWIVRGEDNTDIKDNQLKFIGKENVYTVPLAIPEAVKEIERMGEMATRNLNTAIEMFLQEEKMDEEKEKEEIKKIYELEEDINFLNEEITKYLVKVNQLSLPVSDRKKLGALFHIVNDIERIGDHAKNIAEYEEGKKEEHFEISNIAKQEIREMYDEVEKMIKLSIKSFSQYTKEYLEEIKKIEDHVDSLERELQKNHVSRLIHDMCEAESGRVFTSVISDLERVADHGMNIAFSIFEATEK